MAIVGPGAGRLAVSGGDAVRVFSVAAGTTAMIARLMITHGQAETRETVLRSQGGGVLNDGDLTLTHVVVSHNKAVGVLGVADEPRHLGGAGGGGANRGELTVAGCTILDNQALGVDNQAGVFTHNQAIGGNENIAGPQGVVPGAGGGVLVFQGEATIRGSTLTDNRAVGGAGAAGKAGGLAIGGGILFVNFLGPVTGIVDGCTLLLNAASGGAGGSEAPGGNAQGGGPAAGTFGLSTFSGTVAVSNILMAGNLALGGVGGAGGSGAAGQGGGVFNGGGSTMTVTRSLIVFNRAWGGEGQGDGIGTGGGVFNAGSLSIDPLTVFMFGHHADDWDDCFGCPP